MGSGCLKVTKSILNCIKIRNFSCILEDFRVADDAFAIDDKCGALSDSLHIVAKLLVDRIVCLDRVFVEVGQQGKIELMILFIPGEALWCIDGNAQNFGIHSIVNFHLIARGTQFLRTRASECEWEEQQDNIPAFEIREVNQLFFR